MAPPRPERSGHSYRVKTGHFYCGSTVSPDAVGRTCGPYRPGRGVERRDGPAVRCPRRHLGVVVRRGATGLGPNLAVGVVDVTEDRLKVRLTAPVSVGQDVDVKLTPPGNGRA